MLAHKGEVAQVAPVVVVEVAARVEPGIPQLLVVRLAEEAQVGEVDGAVGVDVGADDHDVEADRRDAVRLLQDRHALTGDIYAAGRDAAAGCYFPRKGRPAVGPGQRIGDESLYAKAQLVRRVACVHPVIGPWYPGDSGACAVPDNDLDVIDAGPTAVVDPLETPVRTYGDPHAGTADEQVVLAVARLLRESRRGKDHRQDQGDHQSSHAFSFLINSSSARSNTYLSWTIFSVRS